jgi:hypothetical protein
MTEPVPHENWIDAPYPFAPPTDTPDDVDKALELLADAIGRANGGARRSMASYLARTPAVSKTAKVLSQLTASRLIASSSAIAVAIPASRPPSCPQSPLPASPTVWRRRNCFGA